MIAPGFLLAVIIALVSLTGIITLFLALNRASYQRYLDKRIAEHSLGKKNVRAFSPLRTALAVLLGAFLALALTVAVLTAITSARLASDDSVMADVTGRPVGNTKIAALEGRTAQDELPGYHRYTVYNGYDTLVYYVAEDPNSVAPQILFYLETDLPRYTCRFNFEIDGNIRNTASWSVGEKTENDWFGFSFPFSFSAKKKYRTTLTVTFNGDEMLRLPLEDIAHGSAEHARSYLISE